MRTRNRGQVLLIFLAGLLAMLGVSALGIDVGYMYTARHELQRCTDAGALAGASAFIQGSWSDPGVRTLAGSRARAFAAKDKVATSTLSPASELSVGFPAAERVRVQASRTVPLFFSRLFLGPTKTITASSVAEASAAGSNVKGLKPWGIPFPWEDTNGNDEYDAGETVHRDCPPEAAARAALSPWTDGPPAAGGGARPDSLLARTTDWLACALTPSAFACILPPPPSEPPTSFFCVGTRVVLKIGTPQNSPKNPSGIPSLQQESGHFFALALDGKGSSVYRDTIADGSQNPFRIGDAVTLEPGDMVGPTRQGVNELIKADPTSQWNAAAGLPESNQYHAGDGSWMNSPRVVRIPIYDPEIALKTGRSTMVIASFAGFWI
jgi:Flp pilus assembly protein TadG